MMIFFLNEKGVSELSRDIHKPESSSKTGQEEFNMLLESYKL